MAWNRMEQNENLFLIAITVSGLLFGSGFSFGSLTIQFPVTKIQILHGQRKICLKWDSMIRSMTVNNNDNNNNLAASLSANSVCDVTHCDTRDANENIKTKPSNFVARSRKRLLAKETWRWTEQINHVLLAFRVQVQHFKRRCISVVLTSQWCWQVKAVCQLSYCRSNLTTINRQLWLVVYSFVSPLMNSFIFPAWRLLSSPYVAIFLTDDKLTCRESSGVPIKPSDDIPLDPESGKPAGKAEPQLLFQVCVTVVLLPR